MSSTHEIRLPPEAVTHPGETVLEYLEFYGWSQAELARRTGLTPKTISEICSGKAPISANTALAFEKVFQRPAHLWLNLQRLFEEAEARKAEYSKLTHWYEWGQKFPLKQMKRLRYSLPAGRSDVDVLLKFFGVSSPDTWRAVWDSMAVSYRQTLKWKVREEAVTAWVREVELLARQFTLPEFDEARLMSSMDSLRQLTREPADKILDPLQEICARSGLAVVIVGELPNTGISGCARWFADKRAVIGLTLRYKKDDQFWFTFFHECGHILLHRGRDRLVIDNAAEDLTDPIIDPEMQELETEASRFAADTLIPARALAGFLQEKVYTSDAIHDFAESIGVGPGIVVGRLQHDGVLAAYQGNSLKQTLDWNVEAE